MRIIIPPNTPTFYISVIEKGDKINREDEIILPPCKLLYNGKSKNGVYNFTIIK